MMFNYSDLSHIRSFAQWVAEHTFIKVEPEEWQTMAQRVAHQIDEYYNTHVEISDLISCRSCSTGKHLADIPHSVIMDVLSLKRKYYNVYRSQTK